MLWLILGGLAVFAAAFLLFNFLRRPELRTARVEHDLEVYRAQLSELERERDASLISDSEAEAAKVEIQRRILAADQEPEGESTAPFSRWSVSVPVAAALLVPVAAFGLYIVLGNPEIPSVPFAERPPRDSVMAQSSSEPGQDALPDVETMIARVQSRLAEDPTDLTGWAILGRSLASLGRYQEAIEAFDQAIGLSDPDAKLYGAKAETMIAAAQGAVTPEARAVLAQALTLDPGDARARFYLAAAKQQAGETQAALDDLLALLDDAPADAAWYDTVRQRAAGLAVELGLDPKAVLPKAAGREAARGPSREDIEAAAEMVPEQQKEMIRSMVGGLAARLESTPDDLQGWQMLARSYGVLGDMDQAAKAYRHVLTLDSANTDALLFLGEAARVQGDKDGALDYWTRLLGQLAPGSAEHTMVQERLNGL